MGILTVGVVTKPFHFEGQRRMRYAEAGITELHKVVDTLLIIPNQNLFRVANEKTTFADAFAMADQVLYSGVACVTDLMVKEGLINLDFADVRAVMKEMGKAMMGTGEASGEKRALTAAEAAISNPLIDDASMKGAKGLLISITGGKDLTLYEVDEAATRIREEVDQDANIIVGATFDENLDGIIRVSVVATGIDNTGRMRDQGPAEAALKELAGKLRSESRRPAVPAPAFAPAAAVAYAPAAPAIPTPAVVNAAASVESAAHAAVAAAILPQTAIDDVSIRPKAVKPSLFEETEAAPAQVEPPPAAFVPPAPERIMRAPRMPRPEDFPLPGRALVEKQGQPEHHPEERRKSLMQRLAAVGLGRRSEAEAPQAPRTAKPMPQYQAPATASARHPEGRVEQPVSEYARRGLQGLDATGRQTPVHNTPEEDQLDIPAFLRRQAN
jgi:cell division protein FtsZ